MDELCVIVSLVELDELEDDLAREAVLRERIVDDHDAAARPRDTNHFAHRLLANTRRHLVQTEGDARGVEARRIERQRRSVGVAKRDVRWPQLAGGNAQHRIRQVDADDFAGGGSESQRLLAGAGRHVQNSRSGLERCDLDDRPPETLERVSDEIVKRRMNRLSRKLCAHWPRNSVCIASETMNALLFTLIALFFLPVFVRRLLVKAPDGTAPERAARAACPSPGSERKLFVLVGIAAFLLSVGVIHALVTNRTPRSFGPAVAVGAALMGIGDAIMLWSVMSLRSWRLVPRVDTGHELCTTGPYHLVRHPIYLAVDLLAVGMVLWMPTLPIAIGAALVIISSDARARIEEVVMLSGFGDRYREYMSHVRRTLPGIY